MTKTKKFKPLAVLLAAAIASFTSARFLLPEPTAEAAGSSWCCTPTVANPVPGDPWVCQELAACEPADLRCEY